ncbi:uncharacterized protein PV07_12728 [Cladophialophora immunda]|uniref:Uncharacterized protein n=1 Tax=Cladophialophora immunda TaxID=569365 RepID=A0A0D1Z2G2_9EURO|nr:uncharacterized protein PV07_12728 [Cladophialophora immunda]KIW21851.1 hypothetical protein PV07_12728 [Cladophialophora immunda]
MVLDNLPAVDLLQLQGCNHALRGIISNSGQLWDPHGAKSPAAFRVGLRQDFKGQVKRMRNMADQVAAIDYALRDDDPEGIPHPMAIIHFSLLPPLLGQVFQGTFSPGRRLWLAGLLRYNMTAGTRRWSIRTWTLVQAVVLKVYAQTVAHEEAAAALRKRGINKDKAELRTELSVLVKLAEVVADLITANSFEDATNVSEMLGMLFQSRPLVQDKAREDMWQPIQERLASAIQNNIGAGSSVRQPIEESATHWYSIIRGYWTQSKDRHPATMFTELVGDLAVVSIQRREWDQARLTFDLVDHLPDAVNLKTSAFTSWKAIRRHLYGISSPMKPDEWNNAEQSATLLLDLIKIQGHAEDRDLEYIISLIEQAVKARRDTSRQLLVSLLVRLLEESGPHGPQVNALVEALFVTILEQGHKDITEHNLAATMPELQDLATVTQLLSLGKGSSQLYTTLLDRSRTVISRTIYLGSLLGTRHSPYYLFTLLERVAKIDLPNSWSYLLRALAESSKKSIDEARQESVTCASGVWDLIFEKCDAARFEDELNMASRDSIDRIMDIGALLKTAVDRECGKSVRLILTMWRFVGFKTTAFDVTLLDVISQSARFSEKPLLLLPDIIKEHDFCQKSATMCSESLVTMVQMHMRGPREERSGNHGSLEQAFLLISRSLGQLDERFSGRIDTREAWQWIHRHSLKLLEAEFEGRNFEAASDAVCWWGQLPLDIHLTKDARQTVTEILEEIERIRLAEKTGGGLGWLNIQSLWRTRILEANRTTELACHEASLESFWGESSTFVQRYARGVGNEIDRHPPPTHSNFLNSIVSLTAALARYLRNLSLH